MTATQSYLLKALLAEINYIKNLDIRSTTIAEVKLAIKEEVEDKLEKQRKRNKK